MSVIVSKIRLVDVDRELLSAIAKRDKADKTVTPYCRVIGVARQLSERGNSADPDNPIIGFRGVFEAAPADATKPTLRSDVCFFVGDTIDTIKKSVVANPLSDVVLVMDVSARRADNNVGYAFAVKAAKPITAVDPLVTLRKK